MPSRMLPLAVTTAGITVTLGLSACGSTSLSNDTGSAPSGSTTTSSSSTASATVDSALAAKLPAKIKAAGVITIGTDATYAPNEFLKGDGKTVQGMDVDILDTLAKRFGVTTKWVPANFDSIILGVQSGKYDIGVSSFTVNAARKKVVNMVSYFSAGTQWAVAKGNPKKVDPNNACGLTVGVQKATVQVDDLTARSKKCTAAGKKPINQVVEVAQDKVTADLVSGKADAMAADSPVALYAVKQTKGQLEAVGKIYDSAPYGIVVPKAEKDFAQAIADALKASASDGSYKQALARWGNESGAVADFSVNP